MCARLGLRVGAVLAKLSPSRSLTASNLVSFRQQESIFIVLNLLILAVLFCLHWYFAAFWGRPAALLNVAVVLGFVLKTAEWLWLQRHPYPDLEAEGGPDATTALSCVDGPHGSRAI